MSLVLARACRGKRNTGMPRKAAHISCYDACRLTRIARPTLDERFSNSSSAIAKRNMGGFRALYNFALHDVRHWQKTAPRDHANKQIVKTR
jgi:hypothetical protein